MSKSKRVWRRRVGRVSVYQRGSRYWVYYRRGRQIRRPVGTRRDEALTLAARINAELAEGAPTLLSFRPIRLSELADKWIDQHETVRRSSIATVRRHRTAVEHLTRYVEQVHPGLRADRFGQVLAQDFVRHLRTLRVSPNGHANTAKRTMRDKGVVFVLGTCRALFNFAGEQRHLPLYAPNPFGALAIDRLPIDDAKPIRPFTPEQELAFFKAWDEWQFSVFFVLAFTVGLDDLQVLVGLASAFDCGDASEHARGLRALGRQETLLSLLTLPLCAIPSVCQVPMRKGVTILGGRAKSLNQAELR